MGVTRRHVREPWRAAALAALVGLVAALLTLAVSRPLARAATAAILYLPLAVVAVSALAVSALVVARLRARLRESEARWREVFENNPTMYFIVDATGTVLSVNPFGAAQLGYTVEELVGQPVLRVFWDADRESVQRHVARCLAHPGQPMSWELRKIRKDGSMLWVRETAKAVSRGSKQPIVLVACEDITERKRAEAELRRSQAYLDEAQHLSRTGSFGWNAGTGEIVWSDEMYRIAGVERPTKPTLELILGRIHPDDVALVRQTIERAAGGIENLDLEYRFVLPDGSVKHVHVVAHPVPDEAGTTEIVGAAMDVSEQRQARAALERALDELRRSEDRLRRTIDTIPGMVWSALPDGSVDFLNQRWVEYHGLSSDEARGGDWQAVVHPDDAALSAETWTAAVRAGTPYEQEVRARRADGQYRWFLTRAVPQRDDAGRIVKWYGTSTDIDDRKRAEAALREAQDELARVVRLTTMGELAASIAHEIRQPLAAIVLNGGAILRWLDRDRPALDEARQAVSWIVRDAGRAEDVIQGLRTLARKAGPRLSPLDLTATIEEVLTLTRGELRRQTVSVHTELDPRGRPVVGDRVQLQQVLLNLLLNGVEAMSGIDDRPRVLTIRSEPAGPREMIVSVEDSGPGLDPATADRIFEPFFTTKPDGLGIGLSICRSIIDAHGGRFWTEPHPPHGTAFRFTLPVAMPPVTAPAAVATP